MQDTNGTATDIVQKADTLFYEQGFEATSFADIAAAVGISRGNFYYHFKTKDQILDAVIARRLKESHAMTAGWEASAEDPVARIRCFIDILIAHQRDIMEYGCPVGTLCGELAKLDHPSKGRAAELFTLFNTWLERQFTALGCAEPTMLAQHLHGRIQGIAVMANAFRDGAFIRREVEGLYCWLDTVVPVGA